MRNFIIDTDTASDDAVAIVMMLRAKDINVQAITCVAGNLDLPKTVRNALLSVQFAGTYKPPVYAGAAKPMFRELMHVEDCPHGEDGFGNTFYPDAEPVSYTHLGASDDVIGAGWLALADSMRYKLYLEYKNRYGKDEKTWQ